MTTYQTEDREDYRFVSFTLDRKPLALERTIDPTPFVPHDAGSRNRRCEEILSIQDDGIEKIVSNIPDAAMLSLVFQAVWIQRWHF